MPCFAEAWQLILQIPRFCHDESWSKSALLALQLDVTPLKGRPALSGAAAWNQGSTLAIFMAMAAINMLQYLYEDGLQLANSQAEQKTMNVFGIRRQHMKIGC